MQLYLDSYGAFLGVRDGMFYVRPRRGPAQLLPLREVSAIFLSRGCSLSTDAMELAVRNGIPMLLTDGIGRPLGPGLERAVRLHLHYPQAPSACFR
jgi:CRISP-associated protein Cas1